MQTTLSNYHTYDKVWELQVCESKCWSAIQCARNHTFKLSLFGEKRLCEAANRLMFRMWFSVLCIQFWESTFCRPMRLMVMCQWCGILDIVKALKPILFRIHIDLVWLNRASFIVANVSVSVFESVNSWHHRWWGNTVHSIMLWTFAFDTTNERSIQALCTASYETALIHT